MRIEESYKILQYTKRAQKWFDGLKELESRLNVISIVGKSRIGKSTIMRILFGEEV